MSIMFANFHIAHLLRLPALAKAIHSHRCCTLALKLQVL